MLENVGWNDNTPLEIQVLKRLRMGYAHPDFKPKVFDAVLRKKKSLRDVKNAKCACQNLFGVYKRVITYNTGQQ